MCILTPEQTKMLVFSSTNAQMLIDEKTAELKQLYESEPVPDCPELVRCVLDEIEKNHELQKR